MDAEGYMELALELAAEAAEAGEIPVGCVIADAAGTVIGRGRNRREESGLATAHAEIEAIEQACRETGGWRLDGCAMYVTLEPCPMCAGAVINSRISALYYGAKDEITGSCGSVINLFMERYGHSPKIIGGVMEKECSGLLTDFFRRVREDADAPVPKTRKKARITGGCASCGLCASLCPEVFRMGPEGRAEAYGEIEESNENDAAEAADSCPVNAVIIED